MASRKTSRRRQHETQDSSRRQGRWAEEQEPARARGQAATLGALQNTGFYRVAPSPRHQHAQRQQHERSGFLASARQVHRGGSMSEEKRTPEEWEDAFEEIVDDPKQHPIEFYGDEDADLGPAIAEGWTVREAIEEYKRMRGEREQA